jgi:DNA-binding transcriptional ArsR family regulator
MTQFADVLDAVWALDIDPTAKLVALRLARHWPRIFPGVKSLAEWTKLDERTVRRALHRLEADKVIAVTRREGQSSVYEFAGVVIPSLGSRPPLAVCREGVEPPRAQRPHPPGHSAPRRNNSEDPT